jgi:hypothetical protein
MQVLELDVLNASGLHARHERPHPVRDGRRPRESGARGHAGRTAPRGVALRGDGRCRRAYPWRLLSLARKLRLGAGIAVNPATPIAMLEPVATGVDFVTILTTEPDFAGERYLPGSTARIAVGRALLPADVAIEADGEITRDPIRSVVEAGASDIVVGRALVGDAFPRAALLRLRSRLPAADASAIP